jgi:hypothetical protein
VTIEPGRTLIPRARVRQQATDECVERLKSCQEWSQNVKWGVDIYKTKSKAHNPDGANIAHKYWNEIKTAIQHGNRLSPMANSETCEHHRGQCNNAEGFAHEHIRRLG